MFPNSVRKFVFPKRTYFENVSTYNLYIHVLYALFFFLDKNRIFPLKIKQFLFVRNTHIIEEIFIIQRFKGPFFETLILTSRKIDKFIQ